MATTRYLEFNSAYRDRKQYPYPAEFVVEISQSGQKDRKQAIDPVSNASPILQWNNSFLEDAAAFDTSGSGGVISVDTSYSTSNGQTLQITLGGGGEFRAIDGFYDGAILQITNGGVVTRKRIVSYRYINATTALIDVYPGFPSTIFTADGVIQNPTPIDTSTANSKIYFFIPASTDVDNAYVGAYIDLVSSPGGLTPESRQITSYNGETHLAILSAATTDNWVDNGTPTEANSNFALRYELPIYEGEFLAVSSNGKVFQLPSTTTSSQEQMIASFIRMIEPVPTTAGFSTPAAPCYQERRIVSYISDDGTFAAIAAAGTTFTIITSSTTDYTGLYITNSTVSETRLISSYNTSTKSGTVSSAWGGGVSSGDTFFIRTAEIETPFTVNPVVTTQTFEIEAYTRDNWTPFNYNGSLVSSQQSICYEVELLNLILPNSTLVSGGRAIYYPYLYVRLESVSSASAGNRGTIYSNNPNSDRMEFRAVVDDNVQPANSPFIKIDSDGMVQTMKFKPTDNFRFGVYLPNGTLFQTVDQDWYSPTLPNPLVQISALFSLKRID